MSEQSRQTNKVQLRRTRDARLQLLHATGQPVRAGDEVTVETTRGRLSATVTGFRAPRPGSKDKGAVFLRLAGYTDADHSTTSSSFEYKPSAIGARWGRTHG